MNKLSPPPGLLLPSTPVGPPALTAIDFWHAEQGDGAFPPEALPPDVAILQRSLGLDNATALADPPPRAA